MEDIAENSSTSKVEKLLRKSSQNRRNAINKLTDGRVTHGLTPTQEPKKLKLLHMEIYNIMVSEPALTQKKIAQRLGVTPATIGIVSRSDMFQNLLIEHNTEVVSALTHTLVEKTCEVQNQALDSLLDTMQTRALEPELALDIVHKLNKNTNNFPTGDGVLPPGSNVQINNFLGDPAVLNKAKSILVEKHFITPELSAGKPVVSDVIGGGSVIDGSLSKE